ncbi:MAG: RluA family pseudouridine synthase [Pseudomonadota bacterium]
MGNTRSVPDSQRTPVRRVTVDAGRAGQRLDNFLLHAFAGVPRSVIYRLCRTGEVRVNGGRAKPATRLSEGDEVRLPPVRISPSGERRVPDALVHRLEQAIVFEDDDLIVLNKPAGVAVHSGTGVAFGVIDALRQARDDAARQLDLVHRLDRDTSGCLLLAKHPMANRELKQLLASRAVEKRYTALVLGRWPRDVRRIEKALLKNRQRGGERVSAVDEAGRDAVTHVTRVDAGTRCTRLELRIETGRTHQIRVHTAGVGHPIVGDTKYGDHRANRQFAGAGCRGMHLHSTLLAFCWRGERRFEVAAPADWADALKL